MNRQFLLILFVLVCDISFGQISFEKGYFINNDNQRIDCLIKNNDWKHNPSEFNYKMSVDSEIETAGLLSVLEFGVDGVFKFVRSMVDIDRSSEEVLKLTKDKAPVLTREVLFLKVLVEGKANLFEYVESNFIRYFYNTSTTQIQQLIFKTYKTQGYRIAKNNRFKQQLWNDLKCDQLKSDRIERLHYTSRELVSYFKDYNNCQESDTNSFEVRQKRDLFNLSIRPRINRTQLSIQNNISSGRDTDFGNNVSFGLGVEAEYIFPYNKNKWAVSIEPTFQSFAAEKVSEADNLVGGQLVANVDYKSIEIPLTVRHYFFLNENSKLFFNVSYIYDFVFESNFEFARVDGSVLEVLDVNTRSNLGIGLGYKQNDRFSLEFKYYTNREVLGKFVFWNTEYKTLSLIFGYTLL